MSAGMAAQSPAFMTTLARVVPSPIGHSNDLIGELDEPFNTVVTVDDRQDDSSVVGQYKLSLHTETTEGFHVTSFATGT